jgi:hypothetical protein
LVLPAFSRDAAGVNVYYGAEWAAYHCHAIVGERVLDFGGCADLNARLRREPIYDGSRRR